MWTFFSKIIHPSQIKMIDKRSVIGNLGLSIVHLLNQSWIWQWLIVETLAKNLLTIISKEMLIHDVQDNPLLAGDFCIVTRWVLRCTDIKEAGGGGMWKGSICFFIQKHLEPFCFHLLSYRHWVVIPSDLFTYIFQDGTGKSWINL